MRAWVSLLIFVHLFAVFAAVTAYSRPSGLQERLSQLFAPYLRSLHLTPEAANYPFARFHLTLGPPNSGGSVSETDFSCEVEFTGKDGSLETISLPDANLRPLVRYRRYQSLVNAAGALAADEENDETSGILPRAIAGSILKQHEASQGVVRLRAHELPEMAAMANVESGRRGVLERFRTVYEAQVFVTAAGVELLKKSTKLETAPVENSNRGSAK